MWFYVRLTVRAGERRYRRKSQGLPAGLRWLMEPVGGYLRVVSVILLHREPVSRPVRAYLRLPHFVGSTAGRKVRGRSVTTVTDPSSALSPEGVVNDCAHCEPIGPWDNGRGRAGADQGMDSDRHTWVSTARLLIASGHVYLYCYRHHRTYSRLNSRTA